MTGTIALQGGGAFAANDELDARLLAAAGADRVVVLPTADAFEQPARLVAAAMNWAERMGVQVEALMVLRRVEAMEADAAAVVRGAKAVYLVGDQPLHLRSVLKDTPLLDALVAAWDNGAVVAVAGEATSVVCTHMVDSRGGAFTVGLELVTTATFVPRRNRWSPDKWHRTVELAPPDLPVVGIDEATALVHGGPGEWTVVGDGEVQVFLAGRRVDLDALPRVLNAALDR